MLFSIQDVELPIRFTPPRPMADEELLRFSAVNEVLRIEQESNGDLVLMSSRGFEGSERSSEINFQLRSWAREDRRGTVTESNGGYRLADGSMRAPDTAWVSWQRLRALTPQQQRGFAPVCPEFVIEVRSASDKLNEQRAKMEMWLANGAELGWLIDPERRVVEIYRPQREPELVEGARVVGGEGPVAGFVLELDRVWP